MNFSEDKLVNSIFLILLFGYANKMNFSKKKKINLNFISCFAANK